MRSIIKLSSLLFFALMMTSALFLYAGAADAKIGQWQDTLKTGAGGSNSPYVTEFDTKKQVPEYLGSILRWGPMVAITFFIHAVLAGYEWMTAAGDSKKVDDAKKRIKNSVIGAILFFAAYLIAYFIIDRLIFISGYNDQ